MSDDVEAPAARVTVRHRKLRPNAHTGGREGSIVHGPQTAVLPGHVHLLWMAGIDRKDGCAVGRREFCRRGARRPTVRRPANDGWYGCLIWRPSRSAVERHPHPTGPQGIDATDRAIEWSDAYVPGASR